MFSIDKFRSEIREKGILRNNRFQVSFAPPQYLRNYFGQADQEQITLRCEAVQMPGVAFATYDSASRFGYGPMETVPYGVAFEDISMTFMIDKDSNIHRFFYTWADSIVNFRARGQTALKDNTGMTSKSRPYEVGYKDSYCTDLTIRVFNAEAATEQSEEEKAVMEAKVYKAYPKILPAFDMAWSATDDHVKLSVPFSYTDFEMKYANYQQKPTQGSI
jgi:hypothetical protein